MEAADQELDLRVPKNLSSSIKEEHDSLGGQDSHSEPDTSFPNSDSIPAPPTSCAPPPIPPPPPPPPAMVSLPHFGSFKPGHPFQSVVPTMNSLGPNYLANLSQREREYLAQRELLLAQQQFLAREAILRSTNGHRFPPMGADPSSFFPAPLPPPPQPISFEQRSRGEEEEPSGDDEAEEAGDADEEAETGGGGAGKKAEAGSAEDGGSGGGGGLEEKQRPPGQPALSLSRAGKEDEERDSLKSGEEEAGGEQVGHQWTFEEQFKQLYELSPDPKRKEFLDDLFSFMQKRGTPVNRIPIMAKQVLDLYELFRLVVSKGGLVEVINKKLWREITKGLNLPSSITSAAFTLRTQYMKYLYPYECEKLKLSTPAELQVAIDGNRREARRPSYSFDYPPVNGQMLAPPVTHTGPPTSLFAPPPPLLSHRGSVMNAVGAYLKPGFCPLRGSGELNLSKENGGQVSPEARDALSSASSIAHHGPSLDDRPPVSDPAKVAAAAAVAAATCNGALSLACDGLSPPAAKRLALDMARGMPLPGLEAAGTGEAPKLPLRRPGSPLPGTLPSPFPHMPPFPSVPLPGASNVRIATQPTSHLPGLPDTALMVSMEINGLNYQGVLFAQPKRY